MKKYVIIGNGTAAIGCIEGIRSVDKMAQITVVSLENRSAYCRPLISYLLQGKNDTEKMKYRPENFYNENNCAVLYGKTATSIDENLKTVLLNDGSCIDYDSLCIATGSSPFVPPMEGLDGVKNKYAFMTLENALDIESAANKESRVLIIGAGLIGLKCAEGLSGKVKSITVCDLADRVLSSILDSECASVVQKHLEQNGLSFLLENAVEKFDRNTAFMKNGEILDFDILITAVGVRPNISLFKEIGGKCGRGIMVNNEMKTSVTDIFAAGDCTESVDISSGAVKVMALMPNAYIGGHCAGVNMAGGAECFDNMIPMNSIGFFGLHLMTAGSNTERGETILDCSDDTIKKFYLSGGKLTGFALIGDTKRAGIYTNMIRSCLPVDAASFEVLTKSPDLSILNGEERRKSLGGVV